VHIDKYPSKYALSKVHTTEEKPLALLCADKEAVIFLAYVFTLLTPKEKQVLRSAQAHVIIWGEAVTKFFPYGRDGVYSNRIIDRVCPSEPPRTLTQFPFSENFSMLHDVVFLDVGPALDALIDARVYKEIPMAKKVNKELTSYGQIPIVRRQPRPGGVYACHSVTTLKAHLTKVPYYIPMGACVDRILTVSRPMSLYLTHKVYSFRSSEGFLKERTSEVFVLLEETPTAHIGYFSAPSLSPGLTVIESTYSPGDIWIRREGLYMVIETKRATYTVSINEGLDLSYMYLDLTQAEKKRITASLSSQDPEFRKAWQLILEG